LAVLVAASAAVLGAREAAAKARPVPKFYVQVLDAMVDPGVPASIKTNVRDALIAALKLRPEVILAPDGAATGGTTTDATTLAAELKKKKLKGLALSVRITELVKDIKPPPEGKTS